jgi:DNA-binding ferritin-like protein
MDIKEQAYQQKMEAQLKQWKAKIDIAEARAEQVGADAKIKYAEQLETINEKYEQAQEKLAELQDASEDAYKEIRQGLDKAIQELSDSMSKASNLLKNQ